MSRLSRYSAIAIGLAISAGCSAQKSPDALSVQPQWWKSAENSPLSITLSTGGRYLDVINRSGKTVTGYTLACVNFSEPTPSITKVLTRKSEIFAPREGVSELASSYKRLYDSCANSKTKLSIVEVNFDNGTKWTLVPNVASFAPKP